MIKRYVLDVRTASAHFPGIGRYVTNLARHLPACLRPDERCYYLTHQPPESISAETDQGRDLFWLHEYILRVAPETGPFSISQQWRVPAALENAQMYHSPYFLMPYLRKQPTVLTVYDLIPLRIAKAVGTRARIGFRLFMTLALRGAQRVIAISEATRQDFRREFGLSAERIVTIPLGVESRFCPQGEGEIERVRRKYGLPERFVFCLGSGRPHKNLAALVSAWGEIRPAGWQLIFGGAREANWLEGPRLPEGIDPPRWIGFVPESDLPSLYSAASLFVFPSLYEGFGLPVLEAMACGAPVVCGRVSSLPEVGGDAALYFDLHATGSLAQALENALGAADLRGELAAKGRERAATFTWARCAQATAQIYRDLG